MDADRSIDICMLSRGRIGQHLAPELLRRGVPITTTDVGGSSGVVHTVYRRTPGCIGDLARQSGGGLARVLDGSDRLAGFRENVWRRRHSAS